MHGACVVLCIVAFELDADITEDKKGMGFEVM